MRSHRTRLYLPPPLTSRGEHLREVSCGAVLDFRPHQAPPNLRLPSGDRAYCGNCARHWQNGAWFWDFSFDRLVGAWRCVLCCVPAYDEVECDCCGLPREVNARLMTRGCWR